VVPVRFADRGAEGARRLAHGAPEDAPDGLRHFLDVGL
jgi:hypothetical protein